MTITPVRPNALIDYREVRKRSILCKERTKVREWLVFGCLQVFVLFDDYTCLVWINIGYNTTLLSLTGMLSVVKSDPSIVTREMPRVVVGGRVQALTRDWASQDLHIY